MAKKIPSSDTLKTATPSTATEKPKAPAPATKAAAPAAGSAGKAAAAVEQPKATPTPAQAPAVAEKPASAPTAVNVADSPKVAQSTVKETPKAKPSAKTESPAPAPSEAPKAEPTPPPPLPSEAEFVASLEPLPTESSDDEASKLELLREVEAQFELVKGANEAIENDQPAESPSPAPEPEPQPAPEPEYYQAPEPENRYAGPTMPHMYIVQIAPELAPVAKVGGLADVVFGLSNELEIRGNSVEIILPKYDCLRYDHIWGLCETYKDLWVPWYGGAIHCTVFFGFVHGRKCFFIEPHSQDNFFNRGSVYGFKDDVLRFAFFTRAAMEFLWKSGKHPDIIHCHDWQTALAPVFLYEIYQHMGMTHPRVCFTIHNFKHQGVT
ncbi:MAG: glycogen/starch synthase, partial [Candidatus Methylumidiphilus sp.]